MNKEIIKMQSMVLCFVTVLCLLLMVGSIKRIMVNTSVTTNQPIEIMEINATYIEPVAVASIPKVVEVPVVKVDPIPSLEVVVDKSIKHYKDLSDPTGTGKPEYFKSLFDEVSFITGVDATLLMKIAAVESSLNPKAKAKRSNATGLFQFTPDTWSDVVKKYGSKYGITTTHHVHDPRANALLAGFHIQSNIKLLKKRLGVNKVNEVDIYLTHLLGRTGSLRYFKMDDKDLVATKMTKAAKNNRKFFYGENKALTRKESYRKINTHITQKVKEFNITL